MHSQTVQPRQAAQSAQADKAGNGLLLVNFLHIDGWVQHYPKFLYEV